VDFGGVVRELGTDLLPEVEVGDWVLAHAGFAIQKLDPAEAAETLALFAELEGLGGPPDAGGAR
jgi:hydrogenase expression/formation protein HypC